MGAVVSALVVVAIVVGVARHRRRKETGIERIRAALGPSLPNVVDNVAFVDPTQQVPGGGDGALELEPVDFKEHVQQMDASGELPLNNALIPREIDRSHLTMIETIGSGAFGAVWKATLDESASAGGMPGYLVAAKTVLDAAGSKEGRNELISEAVVMAQLTGHPNIVALVGVITRGDPFVLVESYCEHGSLVSYLRKEAIQGHPPVLKVKVRLATEVAAGMQHLGARRYIHRDLAARNVLVASGLVAKVADFGLSRGGKVMQISNKDALGNEEENAGADYYRSKTGMFPIRWTSGEAMETGIFTAASDVWSFGIVLVELWQDGSQPYGEVSTQFVMRNVFARIKKPLYFMDINKLN